MASLHWSTHLPMIEVVDQCVVVAARIRQTLDRGLMIDRDNKAVPNSVGVIMQADLVHLADALVVVRVVLVVDGAMEQLAAELLHPAKLFREEA